MKERTRKNTCCHSYKYIALQITSTACFTLVTGGSLHLRFKPSLRNWRFSQLKLFYIQHEVWQLVKHTSSLIHELSEACVESICMASKNKSTPSIFLQIQHVTCTSTVQYQNLPSSTIADMALDPTMPVSLS